MDRLVGASMVALMTVNSIVVIVAVVWLATLDRWSTLGLGLAAGLVGTFAMGLALLPGPAIAAPVARFLERRNYFGAFLCTALSLLYTYVVIAAWSIASLWYFAGPARAPGEAVPLFLLGYGVATAPFSFMAIQEDHGIGTDAGIAIVSAQLATGVGIAVLLIADDWMLGRAVFALLLGIGYILQVSLAQQRAIDAAS